MTHQHDRGALAFGECGQLMRRSADLRHRTGGGFDVVGPHRLDGIDDRQIGFFRLQRGQNIAQVGFGCQFYRAFGQPQPGGAHLHLCGGFLAGDIDHFQAIAGKTGGGLQQKGRFADAGITADQQRRRGHQPTAQHPVQFLDPRLRARRGGGDGGQIGQHQRMTALATQGLGRGAGRQRPLFDDRIPRTTGITAPGPFRMDSATGSAGKAEFLGHARVSGRFRAGEQAARSGWK